MYKEVVSDMPLQNRMNDECSTPAVAPNKLPSSDREALALKIQSIDGCTAGDASRQIKEMAQSLRPMARQPLSSVPRHVDPSPIPLVYVRRTDCSGRSEWHPQTKLLLERANDGW